MKCRHCGDDLNEQDYCRTCGQFAIIDSEGNSSPVPNTLRGNKVMDKFDRFIQCMEEKIVECDISITNLQKQKEFLVLMKEKAIGFKNVPEDDECVNWP